MATPSIYLDHAATTPLAPAVREAMLPWLGDDAGNASSQHARGRAAARAVEEARTHVARLVGGEPGEIVFTGGGTEANNFALKGVLLHPNRRGAPFVVSAIEHKAVLAPAWFLEALGHPLAIAGADAAGRVAPAAVGAAIVPGTALVSVMHGNNEIGTIQPVEAIAEIVRGTGALYHVDAVQSVGHVPVDVRAIGCDLLSVSAHKLGGPTGVGALWVRGGADGGIALAPLLHGGFQEEGLRAGTLNTAAIVGFGVAAARLDPDHVAREAARLAGLRDRLLEAIAAKAGGRITGARDERLPGIASFVFDHVDGDALVVGLDLRGVCASTGSACVTGQIDPSHVLTATGESRDAARGALRLSLGETTTDDDVTRAIDTVVDVVERLRVSRRR